MASSVNKVFLIGRLGKDPELKYSQSGGTPVCIMTVATDSSYKDRNGEMQKQTDWHRIVCYGKVAENCQRYLHKGSQIHVEGSIRYRSWESDGQKKSITEIIAQMISFLDPPKRDSGNYGGGYGDSKQGYGDSKQQDYGYGNPQQQQKLEDVPF